MPADVLRQRETNIYKIQLARCYLDFDFVRKQMKKGIVAVHEYLYVFTQIRRVTQQKLGDVPLIIGFLSAAEHNHAGMYVLSSHVFLLL